MTVDDILRYAQYLSINDRKELVKHLIDTLDSPPPHHSVLELDGLGKEVWQHVDVEAYINEIRDEWDQAS